MTNATAWHTPTSVAFGTRSGQHCRGQWCYVVFFGASIPPLLVNGVVQSRPVESRLHDGLIARLEALPVALILSAGPNEVLEQCQSFWLTPR